METVIDARNLHKQYGDHVAVADISLRVNEGEIFAIVGPNGAGKTTTIESLIGLRQPDSGSVRVLGLDPQVDRAALSRRIGVQLQSAALPPRIKVWEALDLFSSFYESPRPWQPLLEEWGLNEKRDAAFTNLSGGQKQRLFIALALLNDPEIVFLDELTTGLDPQARRATWDLVRAVRDQGKTVILVTHFMDEAMTLANRVAVIDRGEIVALDTPAGLVSGLNQETRVTFTSANGFDPDQLLNLDGVTRVEKVQNGVTVFGHGPILSRVATTLAAHNLNPTDLDVAKADLEDVFLALTGRKIRA